MTDYVVRVHPDAADEAVDAKRWYSRRGGRELGDDFMWRLNSLLERLREGGATLCATRQGLPNAQIRRVDMSRFPYSLFVALEPNRHVIVLAVAHHRRRPGYWLPRLVE